MNALKAAGLLAFCCSAGAAAQPAPLARTSQPPSNSAAGHLGGDAYTRYELLPPATGKFRILYEVTATQPGATSYFNPIRKGSIASDERVIDLATGKPLAFQVVSGAVARTRGQPGADPDGEYVMVTLARPVPADGGEGRILIDKTYEDRQSYRSEGDTIVFERPLGNKRNSVVLPLGYQLVSCNTPSQVLQEPDGRLKISFWEDSAAATPLLLKARPVGVLGRGTAPAQAERLVERAKQTREIVYHLQPPETHSFDLYHDYTETRAGVGTYVNIVRTGSSVSNPSARNLDTGAPVAFSVLRGNAILAAAPGTHDVGPGTEAVVFRFPPVPAGGSARLRFSETYTDPARYGLVGDQLVWDRSFGRPANAVVLPAGWALTNSSVPAVTSQLADGRIRLDFLNPRSDEIAVLVTARRISAPAPR